MMQRIAVVRIFSILLSASTSGKSALVKLLMSEALLLRDAIKPSYPSRSVSVHICILLL
jgi:hypothetical protein